MAIVKARVAECSEWTSPDGKVNITPARIQNWVKEHTSLRDHWDFPVTWGHLKTALPENKLDNPKDEETRRRALSNAGYVKQLSLLPDGGMEAVMDVPGVVLVDGKLSATMKDDAGNSVQNAIKDVSIAFGPWQDGKGVLHKDVIKHIALTPLPVIPGQKGFTALSSLGADKQKETVIEFKLNQKTVRLATDDGDDDKKKNFKKVSDSARADAADNDGDSESESEPDDGLLKPDDSVADAVDPIQQQFDMAKSLMAEMGVPLPDSTNPENFLEHLTVALTVLKGRMKMEQAKDAADQTDDIKTPAEATVPAAQPPQFVMSTDDATMTEREKKLTMRLGEDRNKTRRARIEKLKKASLRPEGIAELEAEAGDMRLALDADCNLADEEIDRKLAFLERHVMHNPFMKRLATAGGGPEHKPASGNPLDNEPKTITRNGMEMTEGAVANVERILELTGTGPRKNGKK